MAETRLIHAGAPDEMSDVVRVLLYANIGVFVMQALATPAVSRLLVEMLGLSTAGLRARAFWQPITYMFLHGGTTHLLMNMLALYLIGPTTERGLGPRQFLLVYALSGILGGVGFLLMDPGGVCVGASGAVFGVFGAFVAMYPRERLSLLFLPFIHFEAWVFALVYMSIEVTRLVSGRGGNVAHSAHIAGAIAGFVYVRTLRQPGALRRRMPAFRRRNPSSRQEPEDTEAIDRILDKVATEGLNSLSPRERRLLERSSTRRPRSSD